MSMMTIDSARLDAIGDAIRDAADSNDYYYPSAMPAAIRAAKKTLQSSKTATANGVVTPDTGYDGLEQVIVNVPGPTLASKTITANGTYAAEDDDADGYDEVTVNVANSYDSADEGKVVSNGALVAQTSRTITADGTYDTTTNDEVVVSTGSGAVLGTKTITGNGTYAAADDGLDGYSAVTVDVHDWPFVDDVVAGSTGFVVTVSGSSALDISEYPANVRTFYNDYAKTKPTTVDCSIDITDDDEGLTLPELIVGRGSFAMEYYGYTYNNTSMISDLGLVRLGDFSQGGATTGNTLSGSIEDYSGIILQGVYNRGRTSNYNTSMLYVSPKTNTSYWAGMKDRNTTYDCKVTFTDAYTCSLSGNRQVIIYGMP